MDEKSCCSGQFCFGGDSPYTQDCQNCGGIPRRGKFGIQQYFDTGLPFDWESFEDMGAPPLPKQTLAQIDLSPIPHPCRHRAPTRPVARPLPYAPCGGAVCAMPEGNYKDGSFDVYVVDQGSDKGYDPTGNEYEG